jgi:S-adenosylmethionine:tRNA ribosyltransferase-isomerase
LKTSFQPIEGLKDFYYELPQHLIAKYPPKNRGDSRLMVLRKSGEITPSTFTKLADFLPTPSLLVLNNTKVIPVRLLGKVISIYKNRGIKKSSDTSDEKEMKNVTGSKVDFLIKNNSVEIFIVKPPMMSGLEGGPLDLECIGFPFSVLQPGRYLTFKGKNMELTARVKEIIHSGLMIITFDFTSDPLAVLDDVGHVPLPPYLKRKDDVEDRERYQTVYASKPGAVAAPTAGLHFTLKHLEKLRELGHKTANINLRVGLGTFRPLRPENLESGTLFPERVTISPSAAAKIREAKQKGVPIVAVGSTSLRALEWAALTGEIEAKNGQTDIFIRPGFKFNVADALITNFHLPCSSLFMLVSAFAGLENIHKAYQLAIEKEWMFFSYGDAMLII